MEPLRFAIIYRTSWSFVNLNTEMGVYFAPWGKSSLLMSVTERTVHSPQVSLLELSSLKTPMGKLAVGGTLARVTWG
jgi:hypothetical protein